MTEEINVKIPAPGSGITPHALTIVGVDTDDGPEHPLWQPGLTSDADEELAESLGLHGQMQPIVIRKNGPRIEVVAGRERVKACRLWNDANTGSKILLQWRLAPRGIDDDQLIRLVIVENEHRRAKPLLWKAKMAARLVDQRNRPVAEVAALFQVSSETIREWLRTLASASPKLVEAAENGEVSAADVRKIADMTHADQDVALELVREQQAAQEQVVILADKPPRKAAARGPAGPARGKKRPRRGPRERPTLADAAGKKKRPTPQEIRAAVEEGSLADDVVTWREFGMWVLGDRPFLVQAHG